jgi:hypothetical protein
MADYYPLLAKAVAAKAPSNPEARREIYERARKALLGQLRAIQPPIPEADIERENQALDEAINRLEGELGATQEAAASPGLPAPEAVTPPPVTGNGTPAAGLARSRLPPRPLPPRPLRPPLGRKAAPALEPAAADDAPAEVPADVSLEPAGPSEAAPQDEAMPPAPAAGFTLPQNRAEPEAQLRPRNDQFHPAAPRPEVAGRRNRGVWIAGAVAALVVLLVATAAWKLRDRPEELARAKPAAPQSEAGNAKLADRVGGQSQPATGAKSTTGSSSMAPADQGPTVAVAHRAALLVEAPEEESKVKTFIGSVVWRLETVGRDAGQPLSTAVRADVDIPDAKLKVALTFQKNIDPALPASHTISIRFTPLAGSAIGDVQQIDSPQMRRDEAPSGDPLSAVPVPIMDNNFLVGLARGDFENRNIDLMKTRAWIDVPMLLKNKRVAKLTLEKGVTGDRAITDALAAWQGQGQGQ